MMYSSVANIFNTYFRGDAFDFVSFKNDVKTLRGVFKNYEEALIAYNNLKKKERMKLVSVKTLADAVSYLENVWKL